MPQNPSHGAGIPKEDGIDPSRAEIHLFSSKGAANPNRTPAAQKPWNRPQNIPFPGRKCFKMPQTLHSPIPVPVPIPAGLAASGGAWKTQKLRVEGKNSEFSWWERLQRQLCFAPHGDGGRESLWVMEGHTQEMSEKGKWILSHPSGGGRALRAIPRARGRGSAALGHIRMNTKCGNEAPQLRPRGGGGGEPLEKSSFFPSQHL